MSIRRLAILGQAKGGKRLLELETFMSRRLIVLSIGLTASLLVVPIGAVGASERPSTASGPQMQATAAHTQGSRPEPRGGDAVVVQQLSSGRTRVTRYSPAMGVSQQQLVDQLRRQGLAAQPAAPPADASSSAAGTAAVTCNTYGHAHTLDYLCSPPARWSRNGFLNPQIYVKDTSGAGWPVGTTASIWNNSPNIHITRTTTSCPTSGQHCVYSTSGNYGAVSWDGQTSITYNSNRFFYNGESVKFNDYYGNSYSPDQRRHVACHELGHVIGLDHNDVTSSCLYYRNSAAPATQPTSDDFNLILREIYPR